MNGNSELLNFVFQNSQMGVDTLKQLLSINEDEEFKKHLAAQHGGYEAIHEAARTMLNESGYDEKGIGAFDKVKTYLMINIQTLTDKSVPHISEMLVIGSNMGVINAIKNIKKYHDAEPNILGLMDRLLKFEEDNIQQLKNFL